MKTGLAKICKFSQLLPISACLLCCLLMSVFFGYFVIRDCVDVAVDGILRISIYHPPPPHSSLPPSLFGFVFFPGPTNNSLSNTSDSYLKSVRA